MKNQKHSYLERKRQSVLELGYEYVCFRNRVKKSLVTLKRQILLFHF